MPAYFTEGFFVRKPAWHEMGVVLDDFPGREEAIKLAGHDFYVHEMPLAIANPADDTWSSIDYAEASGWKALIRIGGVDSTEAVEAIEADDMSKIMHEAPLFNLVRDSYTVIQNDVGWDVVDAIIGAGARYETGITLKDGAVCLVTAWLDEPVQIPGDDSPLLPYLVVRWAHDGSGSLAARSTTVRVVCANTDALSESEAKRLGTEFTFRHTKNVMDRIEEAKMAIRGLRIHHEEFIKLAEELAKIKVTKAQREFFITQFIPAPPEALTSKRVQQNIDDARNEVRTIFESKTVPDAHKYTGWGLRLAGVEWLDHVRGWRSSDTLVGRQLLRHEPAKAKLTTLIQEAVKS